MELHERFVNLVSLDSSIFEIVQDALIADKSIGCILAKFMQDCLQLLKAGNIHKRYLELLRLLLCKHYKSNFADDKGSDAAFRLQSNQFLEFLLHTQPCVHKGNSQSIAASNLTYDILTLQLVLLEDPTNLVKLLENFRSNYGFKQFRGGNKVSVNWYLKVLNCFLSAWELLYFLNNNKSFGKISKVHLESSKQVLLSSVVDDVKSWTYCKDTNEWHALYSLLSKVVAISKNTSILNSYAQELLDKDFSLTTICVISYFIFSIDCANIDIDYSLITNDKLWSTIQHNLLSTNSYDRKQSLLLLKRLIDFINFTEQNNKLIYTNLTFKKIRPFICNQPALVGSTLPINQLRINFILIMEALEEKQKHLVIPNLSLVENLIQGYTEHNSYGECYDFSWIYCIFARIFMHSNNAVVKWGLLRSLKLNQEAYNSNLFILLIMKTLNNTFLYEKLNDETEPSIVTALTTWFNTFQSKNLNLVEKFVGFLSQVTWGPISIYYTLQSLLATLDTLDVKLHQEQLEVIRMLVETNIKLHPPMLRSMIQVTLIKILSRFSKTQNLQDLCNILYAFDLKDIREPYCWPALTSWFATINYNNIINFVGQVCETLTNDDENVQTPMSTFALMIQLFYEGGLIFQSDQCVAKQKLTTLLLFLDKADIRPYVKVSFIIKVIDFIYNLFDLKCSKFPEFIYKLFINYKETVFRFIFKLFNNDDLDYKHIKICTRALLNVDYYCNNEKATIIILTKKNRGDLEEKCLQVLNHIHEHNEIQLLFALQSWSIISCYYKYENKFLLDTISYLLTIARSKEFNNKLVGKIGLDYYTALSKLIKHHVSTLGAHDVKENEDWLKILSCIFDATGNHVFIYFADVLHFYSAHISENDKQLEHLKSLIKRFWNFNFHSKRERIYWLAIQKLTKCINSSEFLNCKSLKSVSEEFLDRTLCEGDTLQVLKYILLTSSAINKQFNYFMETILNGLLHGQVMRRDQRIIMQTCKIGKRILGFYKLKDGKVENFKAYDFLNRQYNIDAIIRAASVIQLCNALHTDDKNACLILPLILKKLSDVQNKRYFVNSQLHRIKHRILQILLVLQPHLNKQSTEILYNALCHSFLQDSDQHSVNLMKEWLLIRIYLSNQDLLSDLWLFFDKICEKRPNSASSFIVIIWHLVQQSPEEKQAQLIKMALPKLGVCCMRQHFGTRLFGQVFFIKLYKLLNKDSEMNIEYASLYKAILEILHNSNFQKYVDQINEHFFYTIFNPIQHYSLETIYHQLPRLCNVSLEEWILKENFTDQIFLNFSIVDLKISNIDNKLDQASIPCSYLKCNENSKVELECSQVTCDIQKKITPWKVVLPNDEEFSEINDLPILKNQINKKKNFIMVASLIDKSQNLGGIARTCEIFGAKELVISNLKQVEDKDFQFLSVSADKWIKIIEVKSFQLDTYLMELKDCGWTLIGAEQTVNSINLFDVKFPEQTALILGNEKNGIPANILPLLDICVEIPQFGVIRSLNVHVSSAICIWEYVKQHRISS